ncbi:MAG: response regulator, partial [Desulfobacterales bacterium]
EEKKRILIVEDESIIAMSLQTILEMSGYDVCKPLSTGEQALEKVEEERPDLVIMDIVLAGRTNGVEAAKQIRSRYDIPVIFITGFDDEDLLKDAEQVKSSLLLLKPFGPDDIEVAIDSILNGHKSDDR